MLEIVILSLIQGLTEFLPVSSSGHLILLPSLLGWQDHSIEIDGILHLGTLCAVVCYFFLDIRRMMVAFLREHLKISTLSSDSKDPFYARLGMTLIVATLPVIIAGLLLKRVGIEHVRSPEMMVLMMVMGGIALYLVDILRPTHKTLPSLTLKEALAIGFIQIIALFPGSSRSGMCILGARLLGFDKVSATRYAFLLSIPAILGASTLIFYDAYNDGLQTPLLDLAAYFSLSFFFGLAAIHFMLRFVQSHSFFVFMIYRVFLGVLVYCIM